MDLENLHQYHFEEVVEVDEALLIGWEILEAKRDIEAGILYLKRFFYWWMLFDQSEIELEFSWLDFPEIISHEQTRTPIIKVSEQRTSHRKANTSPNTENVAVRAIRHFNRFWCSTCSLIMNCSDCMMLGLFVQIELFGLFGVRTVRSTWAVQTIWCSDTRIFSKNKLEIKMN